MGPAASRLVRPCSPSFASSVSTLVSLAESGVKMVEVAWMVINSK